MRLGPVTKQKDASFTGIRRQEWKMCEDAKKCSRRGGSLTLHISRVGVRYLSNQRMMARLTERANSETV